MSKNIIDKIKEINKRIHDENIILKNTDDKEKVIKKKIKFFQDEIKKLKKINIKDNNAELEEYIDSIKKYGLNIIKQLKNNSNTKLYYIEQWHRKEFRNDYLISYNKVLEDISDMKMTDNWEDYFIYIFFNKMLLPNFGKYNIYEGKEKKMKAYRSTNDKNGYISQLPIVGIFSAKHRYDFDDFDFYPKSFVVNNPDEEELTELFNIFYLYKNKYYIIKPSRGSGGKDIIIISYKNIFEDVKKYKEHYFPLVIQKYILNPMLLNNYKFDFRVYVLYINNEVYVNKHFYIRLASEKYNYDNPTNLRAGLTNIRQSKNKSLLIDEVEFFKRYNKEYKEDEMSFLENKLQDMFNNIIKNVFIKLRKKIDNIYLKKKMKSFWHDKKNNYFTLYGFDLMADDTGDIWLLEINEKPSVSDIDTIPNRKIIVEDMFNIILKREQDSFYKIL